MNPYSVPGLPIEKLSLLTSTNKEETISLVVCKYFNAPTNNLKCRCNAPEISEPRMVVIVLLVEILGYKWEQATDYYGMRHATYWHAKRKIRDLYQSEKAFRTKIDRILYELAPDRLKQIYKNLLKKEGSY